jgi:hypothetical protein
MGQGNPVLIGTVSIYRFHRKTGKLEKTGKTGENKRGIG